MPRRIKRYQFLGAITPGGIGVEGNYRVPQHSYRQQHLGWRAEDYRCSSRVGQQTVSLHVAKSIDGDVTRVIDATRKILAEVRVERKSKA